MIGGLAQEVLETGLPKDRFEMRNLVEHQRPNHGKLRDLATGSDIVFNHVEAIVFGDGTVIGDQGLVGQYEFLSADRVFDLDITASLSDPGGSESWATVWATVVTTLPHNAALPSETRDPDGACQLDSASLPDL